MRFPAWAFYAELEFVDVRSLWTLRTFNDVKFNSLTFVQSLESIALDSAEVYEHIVAAFNLNETKALFRVKPFHCTLLQNKFLHISAIQSTLGRIVAQESTATGHVSKYIECSWYHGYHTSTFISCQ